MLSHLIFFFLQEESNRSEVDLDQLDKQELARGTWWVHHNDISQVFGRQTYSLWRPGQGSVGGSGTQ